MTTKAASPMLHEAFRTVPDGGVATVAAPAERILMVYEFPPGEHEWQLRDLATALQRQRPSRRIAFCHGNLGRYRPGGLKLGRIWNGFVVHARAFWQILLGHWDRVLVRSAPPLIQLTVALACACRGVPYWIWLMDAHPELEAELWRNRFPAGWISRRLARLNRAVLARAEIVIVLDEAMRLRLTAHCRPDRIVTFPTWADNAAEVTPADGARVATMGSGLRLVYLGNLGLIHDTILLGEVVRAFAERLPVEMTFFGSAQEAVGAFRRQLGHPRVRIVEKPPVPFSRLAEVLPVGRFDYGLVTLREDFVGLLSPSKYIGYLVAGIPLIYLGPSGTNTALVCDELVAGRRLGRDWRHTPEEIDRLLCPEFRDILQRNCASAWKHFASFNGETLAEEIARRLDTAALQPLPTSIRETAH